MVQKKSILRKLKIYMFSFGLMMGFIFPVYANFFVIWKEGAFVYFFLGCIAAGITVGVVSYVFVKVILLKQLNKISFQATALKNKNISELINIQSNDSVGLIISGLNSAVLSIKNLFTEIRKIHELADTSLSRVEYAGLSGESKIVSIGAIQASITNVTVISNLIVDLSKQIIETVINGKNMAGISADKFKDTSHQVDAFKGIMNSLVGKSDKISEITGMIEDISAITNILSLNASIEAARAGKHGRSFAIVAGEIRKLATSTNESAQKISNYINLIQKDISEANKSVELVTNRVTKNNEGISSIMENFDTIELASRKNLEENKNLSFSINQLNDSFEDIQHVFVELSENITNLKNVIDAYNY